MAIPIAAVKRVDRIRFDIRDDLRFDNTNDQTIELSKNLFELLINDDFLPIYTN